MVSWFWLGCYSAEGSITGWTWLTDGNEQLTATNTTTTTNTPHTTNRLNYTLKGNRIKVISVEMFQTEQLKTKTLNNN